jgi:hypothetical protein
MAFIDKLKKRSWRLWFRVIHRDLGFLIFGLTVIYAISGITLNHINDFNPNYSIDSRQLELTDDLLELNAEELCLKIDEDLIYKKHIDRADGGKRIFVQGGLIDIVPSKKCNPIRNSE